MEPTILDLMLFKGGFNSSSVMLGSTLLGIASGITGVFIMLRKRAMISDAVAHCTLPGLVLSFLIATTFGYDGKSYLLLTIGAAASGLTGLLIIQFISTKTRLSEETAIGAVLSVFFGLGIALLSQVQSSGKGNSAGLAKYIYGQTATMLFEDSIRLSIVCLVVIIICSALLKEFRLLCFDYEYAKVTGWPTQFLDLIMLLVLLLVTCFGLQTVGLLLIVALLVIPAASARFWTDSLNKTLVIAGFFGGLSGYFGSVLSAYFPKFPAGAVIVLCSGVIFVLSFVLAPKRGAIAKLFIEIRLRLKITRDHILRRMYEEAELGGQSSQVALKSSIDSITEIVPYSMWLKLCLYLPLFSRYFYIDSIRNEIIATKEGKILAGNLTRNHRLWELYMIKYAGLAPSHVDYSADFAEHVLSPVILSELEDELNSKERLLSAHPLEGQ